jgi:hypothetical protein
LRLSVEVLLAAASLAEHAETDPLLPVLIVVIRFERRSFGTVTWGREGGRERRGNGEDPSFAMDSLVYVYTHTYKRKYIHKYVRIYVHTYTYIYVHTYIHIDIHTHIHIDRHTCTCMDTYIHTCKAYIGA